jgi:hypothetical protein
MPSVSSVSALYNELFAGNKIQLELPNAKAFDALRVALCKQHQIPKLLLETTDGSLCASYAHPVATFWIGPRKAPRQFTYSIVDTGET